MTVAWLATTGLRGGQILEASSSTCSASHTLLPSASAAPQGSRQCEGVGITEAVQASQSALLHGPEHFLRWGCHSMSSCDGVRPIVVRASSVHPEGVTKTPHKGSSQPPDTGHQPENCELQHEGVSFYLLLLLPAETRPAATRLAATRFSATLSLSLAFEAVQPRLPKSGLWTSVFFFQPTFNQHNLRPRYPRHGQSSFTAQGLSAASKPSRSWRRWHDDNARDSSQMPSHSMAVQSSPQLHSPRSVNDLTRHLVELWCARRTGYLSGRAVVRDALSSTVPTSS